MSNGDGTFWSNPSVAPTYQAVGDVLGNGFPDYKGAPSVVETQTIGDGDNSAEENDFGALGKGLNGAINGALGVLNPLKGLDNAVSAAKKVGGDIVSSEAGPWILKATFFGLGAIFLIMGLWSIFKAAPQELETA